MVPVIDLAARLGLPPACILPGNGSNELIELLGHLSCGNDIRVRCRRRTATKVLLLRIGRIVLRAHVVPGGQLHRVFDAVAEFAREEPVGEDDHVLRAGQPQSLAQKRILLIDDVFTTGTTVNECAKVLRTAGAEAVFVLTLARTVESSVIPDRILAQRANGLREVVQS